MSKLTEIASGIINSIATTKEIKALAKQRRFICKTCPVKVGRMCSKAKGGCGCIIAIKVRSESSKCPLSKW